MELLFKFGNKMFEPPEEIPDGYELWYNDLDGYILMPTSFNNIFEEAERKHKELMEYDPDEDAWMFVRDDI